MKKIILLVVMFTLVSCEDSDYKKLMEPVISKKKADKNPSPVFFGEVEPEVPSIEEIKKTILGPDKNNNGIRDDVDVWINRTGENYNEVMALRSQARADQEFLKAAVENRTRDAEPTMNKSIRAGYCMNIIFSSNPAYQKRKSMDYDMGRINYFPKIRGKTVVGFYKHILRYGGGEHDRIIDEYKYCDFQVENPKEVTLKFMKSIGIKEEVMQWEE